MKAKLFLFTILAATFLWVGGGYTQPTPSMPPLTVQEEDGSPIAIPVYKLKFTNGTVTVNADKSVSVTVGAAVPGDITDVWSVSSGNVDALTAAAGDSLDASAADSSWPFKSGVAASLPGTCTADKGTYWATDTDTFYFCSATDTWTDLGSLLSLTSYVAKATFDAHTILYATTDDTPAALTVGEQKVVGRATGGNITGLDIDSDISSTSANDDTVPSAKATKTYADTKQTADADLSTLSSPTAWRVFYSDGSNVITELALGASGTYLKSNGASSAPTFETPGGAGDVVGPASATDNALARFDGTGGKTLQNSGVIVDDSNYVTGVAKLTMADDTLIDLSGITMSGTNDEGLTLPYWGSVSPTSDKRFITWDESAGTMKVWKLASGWIEINPGVGAPTSAAYLLGSESSGSCVGGLTAEKYLVEGSGMGIDIAVAGTDCGTVTFGVDPTKFTGDKTWAAGGAASITWTWNNSGTTDPTLIFGDGLISTNSSLTLATGKNLTIGTTQLNLNDTIDASKITIGSQATGDLLYASSGTAWGRLGAGSQGTILQMGASLPAWSTATWPTAATSGKVVYGNGTNYVESTPTLPLSSSATSGKVMKSDGTNWVASTETYATPSTSGNIMLSDGTNWTSGTTLNGSYTFSGTNTFTGSNTIGDGDTDTLTIQSVLRGSTGRPVAIDDDTTIDTTYATGTNDLYVEDVIHAGGTIYAESFVSTSTGDSYINLSDNTTYNPSSGYQLYFEGGVFKVYNGTEQTVIATGSSPTLTGTTWDFTGVTNFKIPNTGTADGAGEIAINDTAEQFLMYVNGATKYFDFSSDSSGYVLKSNGTGGFSLQADATGGTPTWNSISNPTGALSLTMSDAAYDTTFTMAADAVWSFQYTGAFTSTPTAQFLIQQQTGDAGAGSTLFEVRASDSDVTVAKIGSGTNGVQVSQAGALTVMGSGTIVATGLSAGTAPVPASAGGVALGSAALEWDHLYLYDAAVIYGQADQSNTLTSSATGWTANLLFTSTGGFASGEGATGPGFLRLLEDTDNGSDYSTITGASDAGTYPSFTFSGSQGSEDLTLTASSNTWTVSSSTGVTDISFSALNLATTGIVSGKIGVVTKTSAYTLGTDDSNEAYGYMVDLTGVTTLTLPAAVAGMSFCVYSRDANVKTIEPNGSDVITLDGTALTGGYNITSDGAIGDYICIFSQSANNWTNIGYGKTAWNSGS